MQKMEHPLSRLLFADSLSVIQECIELIKETVREHGIINE